MGVTSFNSRRPTQCSVAVSAASSCRLYSILRTRGGNPLPGIRPFAASTVAGRNVGHAPAFRRMQQADDFELPCQQDVEPGAVRIDARLDVRQ